MFFSRQKHLAKATTMTTPAPTIRVADLTTALIIALIAVLARNPPVGFCLFLYHFYHTKFVEILRLLLGKGRKFFRVALDSKQFLGGMEGEGSLECMIVSYITIYQVFREIIGDISTAFTTVFIFAPSRLKTFFAFQEIYGCLCRSRYVD